MLQFPPPCMRSDRRPGDDVHVLGREFMLLFEGLEEGLGVASPGADIDSCYVYGVGDVTVQFAH